MATTRDTDRGRMRSWHGGPVLLAVGATFALLGAFNTTTARQAAAETAPSNDRKVYVCKYVGKPGVDERLQTGNNPIEVSENAIPDPNNDGVHVGDEFADAQGRSIVIQIGGYEPGIYDCPAPDTPTTPTQPPTNPTLPPTTTTEPPTTTTTVPATTTTQPATTTTTAVQQLGPATTTTSPATTTTHAAVVTTTTSAVGSESGSLPGTGSPSWTLIALGSALMLGGLALTAVSRTRSRTRS